MKILVRKIFTTVVGVTFLLVGVTPVMACNSNYADVNGDQETRALVQFAKQYRIADINQTTITFKNSPQAHHQQVILWSFNTSKNSTLKKYSQLLARYAGIMVYHNGQKTFTLWTKPVNPFATPVRYLPGYYDSDFNIPSYITGNTEDFTIVANSDYLELLTDDVDPVGGVHTIQQLFANMSGNNLNNFSGLTLQDLSKLSDRPTAGKIPENHFAVIHIQKSHNQYHIVGSNLATEQDKKIFPTREINSFFGKQTPIIFHLGSSHEFVLELTQLYQLRPNVNNPWFTSASLQKLFKQTPPPGSRKAGTIYLATVPQSHNLPTDYQKFNVKQTDLIAAIQSLIKTPAIFEKFNTFVKEGYHNSDLVFDCADKVFNFKKGQKISNG